MVQVSRSDRMCNILMVFIKLYILYKFVGNTCVRTAVMFPLHIKRRFRFLPVTSSFIKSLLTLAYSKDQNANNC